MFETKKNYYEDDDECIIFDNFIGERVLQEVLNDFDIGVNNNGDIVTYSCLGTENKILLLKNLQKQLTVAITEKIINILENNI